MISKSFLNSVSFFARFPVLKARSSTVNLLLPRSSVEFSKHLFSTSSSLLQNPDCPNKVVFISQSSNVFANLAMEAWLYKNWNFHNNYLLFMWSNKPCVVIGRHQNPFKEVNLQYLESAKLPFARRHSGGGAVYHDLGNLNCTFFTPRKGYNRKWNLELICESLRKDFGLDVEINSRDDILLNKTLKVSGSAAKLGRDVAYHHCSLMFTTDKLQLSLCLSGDRQMSSKATESVRSSVGNLSRHGYYSMDKVINSIGFRYLEANLPSYPQASSDQNRTQSSGLTLINPEEDWFPGHQAFMDELQSDEWLYGMTPQFSKTLSIKVPDNLFVEGPDKVSVEVVCQKSKITQIKVNDAVSPAVKNFLENDVKHRLKDITYSDHLTAVIEMLLLTQMHDTGSIQG